MFVVSFCHFLPSLFLLPFFVLYYLVFSLAGLMAGGDIEAGRALWDRMVGREPDDFVPRGPVSERLLLDHHRRWAAALVSSSSQGVSASAAVTVASGSLMRGVD